MHLYERELERVVLFARGLGVKVLFIRGGEDGSYVNPKDENDQGIITINSRGYTVAKISSLLHELGHHMDFVKRGRMPEAYDHLYAKKTPRWARQSVCNAEARAVEHALKIYWDLMLRVPLWRVKKDLAMDLYQYRVWLRKAQFPTGPEQKAFGKRWDRMYRKALLQQGPWWKPE